VVVDDYELIQDSGGAGKFRGAQSYVKQITNLGDAATLQLRSDKRKFPPYGLQGGSTGSPSLNILNPGADETLLPTLAQVRLERGGVIRHEMAGGGGWGDPLTRDPTAVLEDVLDGRVSINSAKKNHLNGFEVEFDLRYVLHDDKNRHHSWDVVVTDMFFSDTAEEDKTTIGLIKRNLLDVMRPSIEVFLKELFRDEGICYDRSELESSTTTLTFYLDIDDYGEKFIKNVYIKTDTSAIVRVG